MTTKNPTHYSRWKIEPIEFIRANKLDALRANIIKYIMRFDAKDGQRDLDKAKEYLRYLEEDWNTRESKDVQTICTVLADDGFDSPYSPHSYYSPITTSVLVQSPRKDDSER